MLSEAAMQERNSARRCIWLCALSLCASGKEEVPDSTLQKGCRERSMQGLGTAAHDRHEWCTQQQAGSSRARTCSVMRREPCTLPGGCDWMARWEGPPPRPTVPPRPWNSVIFTPASLHTWTGRPAASRGLLSAVALYCMCDCKAECLCYESMCGRQAQQVLPPYTAAQIRQKSQMQASVSLPLPVIITTTHSHP